MDVLVIAEVVALLCVSALCIYLILVLIRLRDVLSNLEKDVKDVTARTIPVLENMEYITSRVRGIADSIDDQIGTVREAITSVKSIADSVVAFERRVQDQVEGPVLESIAFVAAIFKGFRAFVDRFRA
jgi:uncharacterized protein YoxC